MGAGQGGWGEAVVRAERSELTGAPFARCAVSSRPAVTGEDAVPFPASAARRFRAVGRAAALPHLAGVRALRAQLEAAAAGAAERAERAFEEEAAAEGVVVGVVPHAEVAAAERQYEADALAAAEREAELYTRRQVRLAHAESHAKRRVLEQREAEQKKLATRREASEGAERAQKQMLRTELAVVEEKLVGALAKRKATVQQLYGEMEVVQGGWGNIVKRSYRVDWAGAPTPLQIRLRSLAGVRDKLPRGKYVLLATVYERLGGDPLKFAKLQSWGASAPFWAGGDHRKMETDIEQDVYVVAPSELQLRPSMCLVFELFRLAVQGEESTSIDRVVGWGAFPICTLQMRVVKGCFVAPMLRGEPGRHVDTYEEIEAEYGRDLGRWLGNLYFEVSHLPRYANGVKEYEVELLVTSSLLRHPDRSNDDHKDPTATANFDVRVATREEVENRERLEATRARARLASASAAFGVAAQSGRPADRAPAEAGPVVESVSAGSGAGVRDGPGFLAREPYKEGFTADEDLEDGQLPTIVPSRLPSLAVSEAEAKAGDAIEENASRFEAHRFALRTEMGGSNGEASKEVSFVWREILWELGWRGVQGMDLWLFTVGLALACWLRIYVHYLGQFAVMDLGGLVVEELSFSWLTCRLAYKIDSLPYFSEIGIVCAGPAFNFLLALVLMLAVNVCHVHYGGFPELASRYVMMTGVAAMLDPLLILVADLATGNTQYDARNDPRIGDAFKLPHLMEAREGNSLVGILLTIIIYAGFMLMCGYINYQFILRVHQGGRAMDTYKRIAGRPRHFFVPQDYELSLPELISICEKARRYRGAEGERRLVRFQEYKLRDAADPKFAEVTTHVVIKHLAVGQGEPVLYRHFVQMPDGTIQEIGRRADLAKQLRVRGYNIDEDGAGWQSEKAKAAQKLLQNGSLAEAEHTLATLDPEKVAAARLAFENPAHAMNARWRAQRDGIAPPGAGALKSVGNSVQNAVARLSMSAKGLVGARPKKPTRKR